MQSTSGRIDMQARHEGRIVGRAERMQDLADIVRADRRLRALEAAHHFMAIGIIGDEMGDLLALLQESARATAAAVICGFSASWKVYLLKSLASLMVSDWLIET